MADISTAEVDFPSFQVVDISVVTLVVVVDKAVASLLVLLPSVESGGTGTVRIAVDRGCVVFLPVAPSVVYAPSWYVALVVVTVIVIDTTANGRLSTSTVGWLVDPLPFAEYIGRVFSVGQWVPVGPVTPGSCGWV